MSSPKPHWLIVALLGCCAPIPEPTNPTGPAVCEDGPTSPTARVERDIAVVGAASNTMRRFDDAIYVVESGENTISRFDLETQQYVRLVDVGNERSPWDLWVSESELWITNYISNTLTVADRETGEVLVEIEHESFDGPSGVAVLDGRVYVSNVEFRETGDFGAGSVTVLSETSREVLAVVPTKRQNPSALDVIDGRLLVVDSGVFLHDGERFIAGSEAAIELWTPTPDPSLPEVTAVSLRLADDRSIGVPGRPAFAPDSSLVFLPSATAPVVFIFDVSTATWLRGTENAIRLYETDRDALHHAAMGEDGILYVTAFNEDSLYLVDTSCDAVLDVIELESSSLLAGPHGVVPVRNDAYFLLAHANELGRVQLDFGDPR